jgi:hypothetical protein
MPDKIYEDTVELYGKINEKHKLNKFNFLISNDGNEIDIYLSDNSLNQTK